MARTVPTGRSKPGTVPKGERDPITIRVPPEHKVLYDRLAKEGGYDSLSDYICARMAALHDLEVPEYVHRRRKRSEQDALPMAS